MCRTQSPTKLPLQCLRNHELARQIPVRASFQPYRGFSRATQDSGYNFRAAWSATTPLHYRNLPTCNPQNSLDRLKLVSVIAGSRDLNEDDILEEVVPQKVIAITRTISFLLVVLIAFSLGVMSVSFSGTRWAWMALVAFIVSLVWGGVSVLRAIWGVSPPEAC